MEYSQLDNKIGLTRNFFKTIMLELWRNTIVPSSQNLASIYQTFAPLKEYRYNDDELTSEKAKQ